jgi:hypothetical protein
MPQNVLGVLSQISTGSCKSLVAQDLVLSMLGGHQRSPLYYVVMPDALCEHLSKQPGSYIDEMAVFLWKEFNILRSHSSIRQALSKRG